MLVLKSIPSFLSFSHIPPQFGFYTHRVYPVCLSVCIWLGKGCLVVFETQEGTGVEEALAEGQAHTPDSGHDLEWLEGFNLVP